MYTPVRLRPLSPVPSQTLPRWTIPRPRPLSTHRIKLVILALAAMLFCYSAVGYIFLETGELKVEDVGRQGIGKGHEGLEDVAMSIGGDGGELKNAIGKEKEDGGGGAGHGHAPSDEMEYEDYGGGDDDGYPYEESASRKSWYSKLAALNPFKGSPKAEAGLYDESRTAVLNSAKYHSRPHSQSDEITNVDLIMPDRLSLGEKTRIAKVSILYGHPNPVYERALRTHEAHDRLHNYPIFVVREPILDGLWTKPAYILSLILRELEKPESQRLEWLFWVDADTIILNYKVPVELFLPPEDDEEFKDIHMLVSHDWNGLNNGVFPIRINAWAAELFSAIVAFRLFRPKQELVFNDQSAMDFVLQERKFAKHVVQVPQRWFNAYQGEANETLAPHQVRRGDFLVHFPGVGDREARMRFWLDRAEKHLPEWEMDLVHTSYPSEVKEFWSDLKRERAEQRLAHKETTGEIREYVAEVEKLIGEYGQKIPPEALEKIRDEISAANMMVDARWELKQDISDALFALTRLKEMVKPLTQAAKDGRKSAIKASHALIFEAEHVLVEFKSVPGLEEEVMAVDKQVEELKSELGNPEATTGTITAMMEQLKSVKMGLVSAGKGTATAAGKEAVKGMQDEGATKPSASAKIASVVGSAAAEVDGGEDEEKD